MSASTTEMNRKMIYIKLNTYILSYTFIVTTTVTMEPMNDALEAGLYVSVTLNVVTLVVILMIIIIICYKKRRRN